MVNNTNPFGSNEPNIDLDPDNFSVDMPEGDSSFRVPEGTYPAKCVSVKKDFSQSSGNPMWVWDFAITEGPAAGKEFRTFTVISAAAMWKLREVLVALGFVKADGSKANAAFKKTDVIGRLCQISLVDDEYKGVKRSSIQAVLPPASAPAGAKMSDDVPL